MVGRGIMPGMATKPDMGRIPDRATTGGCPYGAIAGFGSWIQNHMRKFLVRTTHFFVNPKDPEKDPAAYRP